MISVDRLINDLTALNIDHQEVGVYVQVDVAGVPHRLKLGAMEFGLGGTTLVLVGEPEPVPDPVIPQVAQPDRSRHDHVWVQDNLAETWHCAYGVGCVTITFQELLGHPVPETEAQGFALLNHIAELKLTPMPKDAETATTAGAQ